MAAFATGSICLLNGHTSTRKYTPGHYLVNSDQILPRSTVFLPAAIDPSGGGSTGDLTPAAALMPRLAEGYDPAEPLAADEWPPELR